MYKSSPPIQTREISIQLYRCPPRPGFRVYLESLQLEGRCHRRCTDCSVSLVISIDRGHGICGLSSSLTWRRTFRVPSAPRRCSNHVTICYPWFIACCCHPRCPDLWKHSSEGFIVQCQVRDTEPLIFACTGTATTTANDEAAHAFEFKPRMATKILLFGCMFRVERDPCHRHCHGKASREPKNETRSRAG